MKYDCFISYHNADRSDMLHVRDYLSALGISSFLDREHLIAGTPWPQALEDALHAVSSVVVFLGREGVGTWQKREIGFALDRQAQEEKSGGIFPVIPVLLPGSDPQPGFLFLNTWIDLRNQVDDSSALSALKKAIKGQTEEPSEVSRTDISPFRGLEAFHEEHAAFFCGREAFTQHLIEAALSRPMVTVVGASGSGKSSVCQAGLLPALRRQRPPKKTWDAVVFTPGERPFDALATVLIPQLEPELTETDQLIEARKLGRGLQNNDLLVADVVDRILRKSAGTDRLLILADQFEELFTIAPEPDREPFVVALLNVVEKCAATLVVTLRADYFGYAINLNREFSDSIGKSIVTLGPMKREELQRSILEPATRVGLDFETGLVQRIFDDIGEEPGYLPLLQFALTELWDRREQGMLTHAGYDAIEGVTGALAQRAESLYGEFTEDQRLLVRQVFTRLTRVTRPEEGGEDTRRRIFLSELNEEEAEVVKQLSAARLLVMGSHQTLRDETVAQPENQDEASHISFAQTVEVAHEALINGWDRLKEWLNEDRQYLLWRQRLHIHLAEWERSSRDVGTLLRGSPLQEAERWFEERQTDLSPNESAFVAASIKNREQEAAQRQSERRAKKWRIALFSTGAVISFFLIFVITSARVKVTVYFPGAAAEEAAAKIVNDVLGKDR